MEPAEQDASVGCSNDGAVFEEGLPPLDEDAEDFEKSRTIFSGGKHVLETELPARLRL